MIDRLRAIAEAREFVSDAEHPGYEPFDRDAKLGALPWDRKAIEVWESAHGHDVRLKCSAEFGCLTIESRAARIVSELLKIIDSPAPDEPGAAPPVGEVTESATVLQQLTAVLTGSLRGRGRTVSDWPDDEAAVYRQFGLFGSQDRLTEIRMRKAASAALAVIAANSQDSR